MGFPFDALRRHPDVEGEGLVASDAADRLILDESAAARAGAGVGEVVVIGDGYGALALGAAYDGARGVRVHQDALTGEQALALGAAALGLGDRVSSLPLGADLVRGARVVLMRLPRSLAALRDAVGLIAAHAHPDVAVFAGGRIKHLSLAMNDVLGEFFARVDVSHARQKSRVLIARGPHDGADPVPAAARVDGVELWGLGGVASALRADELGLRAFGGAAGARRVDGLELRAGARRVDELEIRAFGGAFAGARIDIGTRSMLAALADAESLPGGTASDPWIDLACGTGVVAAWLALRHPDAVVYASDQSAAAVASARATAEANGVAARVRVARDDALSSRPDASASFIALNPPFHSGAALTGLIAERLFADAARVLRPGGELWCVWNSPLRYRPTLERLVGPTRQLARDPRFTVTVSTHP